MTAVKQQPMAIVLLALWALALLLVASLSFELARFFVPALWAFAWHFTLMAMGRAALGWLGFEPRLGLHQKVWGWAAGLGIAGLCSFGLFSLGLGQPLLLMVLWAIFGVMGLVGFWRFELSEGTHNLPAHWKAFAVFGGVMVFSGLVPPLFYDTAVYHFGVIQQMGLWGQTLNFPHSSFVAMPMITEMALGIPYWLSEDPVVFNASNAFGFLLLGLAASVTAQRHFPKVDNAGLMLAVAACPLLVFVAGSGKPDWFTAVCFAGTVYTWLEIAEKSAQNSTNDLSPHLLFGFFSGLMVSTKYHGLLFIVLLVAFLILLPSTRRTLFQKNILYTAVVFALSGGPFLFRNLLFYKNPVYPFGHGVLGGDFNARTSSLYGGIAEQLNSAEAWMNLPFKLSFWVTDGTMNDLMGPLWLFLLPLLFLARPWPQTLRFIFWLVLVMSPFWAFSNAKVRYFAPLWLLLFWLCGWAWSFLMTQPSMLRRLGQIGVTLLVMSSWLWNLQADEALLVKRGKVLLGHQTQQKYLEENYGPHDAYAFLSANTPADARVWVLGEPRIAYLDRQALFSDVFVKPLQDHWLATSENAAALRRKLDAAGVTHVVIAEKGLQQLKDKWGFGQWTEPQQEIWRRFLNEEAKVMYRANHWSVLQLNEGEDRKTP